MKKIYLEKKTCIRFDEKQVLVYMNEEVVNDYVPEDAPEDFKPTVGYAYTGPMDDGGTLIDAEDDSRNSLINGIIRTKYSQTEEDAIKTHQLMAREMPAEGSAGTDDWAKKYAKYDNEWSQFLAFRQVAIDLVDSWQH